MFIQNLNAEQQGILLVLAKEIMKADGELHEMQKRMINILKEQADASISQVEFEESDLIKIFSTKREKFSLMLELIAVAQADKEYHEDEKQLISKYANILSISPEELDKLESWVDQQMKLANEAEQLMSNS